MSQIKKEEWEKKGIELFGEDRTAWRFVCPSCGHVASINDAKEKYPEIKGRGWSPPSECVGRYLKDLGCDWCAYGLFHGPLAIETEDGEVIFAFDFEGKPFTK